MGALLGLALASPAGVHAAATDCATDWANFANNPGFTAEYTDGGQVIADHETSSDPSHGPAAIPPAWTDLSSGSPGADPGPFATSFFGYYNGGTVYDPDDVTTMQDDYILFRMRVAGDPRKSGAFDSKHWNVLFDVDGDGYKEFWVDLDGSVVSSPGNPDSLKILYDDNNRQNVPDPAAAEVDAFTAFAAPDGGGGCPAGSPGLSHTRVLPVGDGTGDYYIEMQVPMTAFTDLQGNQVLYPDSPVAFVFSTGASNQDPLQKDFMKDLEFLSLADPIAFGDTIIPNGQPLVQFVDAALESADFYVQGDPIYLTVTDRFANTDPNVAECITVTVTDPLTGDDEIVTLCESNPNSGFFTNQGGSCSADITFPVPAPSPPTAWLRDVATSAATLGESWTIVYSSGAGTWTVVGSVSGLQAALVTPGVPYSTDGGELSFTLYQGTPATATTLSTCTLAADPLGSSGAAGLDDDGTLQVFGGDEITVSYTNPNSITVTDTALIIAACEAIVQFTRANGDPTSDFELNSDSSLSDRLYVTVILREANSDPGVAETIQVTLTGNDTQTVTLTETGPDTGEFRNAGGLATQVSDGSVTPEDGLWEDVDGGAVTATYDYTCGGNNFSRSTTASLFFTDAAGRVAFTNGAGTLDVSLYGSREPVFLRVTDENACTATIVVAGVAIETVTVVVTTDAGDSETVTLYETFPGSAVFMNRLNDLVTGAGSPVVTAASGSFVTDGIQAGDAFALATGPDAGLYTVASVQGETQLTLTQALSSSRTGIGYDATPLVTQTSDGTLVANDELVEADHEDGLLVSYADCDDGDLDPGNDVKTDTATYNAPQLVLDWVLFHPDNDPAAACLTESIEILNSTAGPIVATGYDVRDSDSFSYAIPQFGGSDLVLQPGEAIFISLWNSTPPADFYDSGSSTYFLFSAGPGPGPPDELGDPDDGDPADQVLLVDPLGTVQDYIGWSATLSPSVDFYGDDSPAVLRAIWLDDAFRNVAALTPNQALRRNPRGFDTNQPGDWIIDANNSACTVLATRAAIGSIRARRSPQGILVEWTTSSEEGSVGFDLRRLLRGRDRDVRVNDFLVPAAQAPQGAVYRVLDRGAPDDGALRYVIVEHEVGPRGRLRERRHGPFDVVPEPGGDAGDEESPRGEPLGVPDAQRARLAEHAAERGRAPGQRGGRVGSRVRVSIREDGLYRLDAAELASLFGLPEKALRAWIGAGQLSVSQGGLPVAWSPAEDRGGLLFYGQSIDEESVYDDENVYWVEKAAGVVMEEQGGPGPRAGATATSFVDTLHLEENHFAVTNGGGDPERDFWYWGFVAAGNPWFGRHTASFALPDLAPDGGAAPLAVHLKGGSDLGIGGEHHVEVRVNGGFAGEGRFTGFGEFTLWASVGAGTLRPADNTVEVIGHLDTGAAFSLFYLESIDLGYPRRYRARDDALHFSVDAGAVVTVGGFSAADVEVFDVTSPRSPRRVRAVRIGRGDDGYEVTLRDHGPGGTYLALAGAAVARPDAIVSAEPSPLRSGRNAADYLVIAPRELIAAAGELADYRRGQGLQAAVASFEEIVDEFGHGLRSPYAIRALLDHAVRTWAQPPRYVALAGAGHYDYKGYSVPDGNLLPPLLIDTGQGYYAADNLLADLNGDGVPELAVGRIPVVSSEELRRYVSKLSAWESGDAGAWRQKAVLLADDNPNGVGDFTRDSESMAGFLPRSAETERLYIAQRGAQQVRSRLLETLGQGAALVNFVGHGGFDRLTDEAVLRTADISRLGNAGRTPLVTAFTCVVNRHAIPGLASIGELLVLEPSGGAVAVWGPSGLSEDRDAAVLGRGFFDAAFRRGEARLGDAVRSALVDYAGPNADPLMLRMYNLLGDPALELRLPR